MPINPESLERIREAQIKGPSLANILTQMAELADSVGAFPGEFTLDYSKPEELKPGELAPVIILCLRRAP